VPAPDVQQRNAFLLASAAAVLAVLGFIAWMLLRLGGDSVTIAVDDIGEAVAAFVAAACCVIAATRPIRQRRGWWLLAASAAVWGAGEVVWSVYEVGLAVQVPFPSAADVGFLGSIPLAAAGILTFFSTPRGTSVKVRLWLDGSIVFLSLFFVSWALGLSTVFQNPGGGGLVADSIALAYPLGDIVVGTILILAIRRAADELHGRLLLLLGGLAANALADSVFASLTANGTYGAIGSVLDAGWVAGFLMIGLAAIWPMSIARRTDPKDQPIDLWQLVLPWLAILAAGVSGIVLAASGHTLDSMLTMDAGVLTVLVMVSQVYAHKESLTLLGKSRRDAKTLNDIVLYAPLGVLRVGVDGTIIQANPRAGELLRRPDTELVKAPLSSLLPQDEMTKIAGQFQSLSGGAISSMDSETKAVRGDGTTMWLHWSATGVRNANGAVDYLIVMINDTTSRHEAEVAAMSNLNALERLNRLKSEFITMVSHEFRTALVGIQGFSEMMRDEDRLDIAAVKEYSGDIYNDAQRLDKMLDRMLDLDGVGAAEVEMHVVPIDLAGAVRDAVARAEGSHAEHRFEIELEPDMPIVAADGVRLAQLLDILLSNASRYSPATSEITVTGRQEPGQNVISVRDHGLGMPSDFNERLFARYQWSANNPTTKVIGTGLGLPMARQIVEIHGGRIWFESTLGVGSEFHFSLPFAEGGASTGGVKASPVVLAR
jgi:two-component system, sensor histidine kinase and response regulator